MDRLGVLLPEIIELQQRSAARMTRGDHAVLAKVHIIQFPSPDAAGNKAGPIIAAPSNTQPPDLPTEDVLTALEHPTRVHSLMVLNERISFAAEIGRELGRQSDHVTYHLKKLRKLGLIELAEISETPGGRKTGKFYRALIRPWFDLETWETVDPKRRAVITATMLGLCNTDIAEAVRSGTSTTPTATSAERPSLSTEKAIASWFCCWMASFRRP